MYSNYGSSAPTFSYKVFIILTSIFVVLVGTVSIYLTLVHPFRPQSHALGNSTFAIGTDDYGAASPSSFPTSMPSREPGNGGHNAEMYWISFPVILVVALGSLAYWFYRESKHLLLQDAYVNLVRGVTNGERFAQTIFGVYPLSVEEVPVRRHDFHSNSAMDFRSDVVIVTNPSSIITDGIQSLPARFTTQAFAEYIFHLDPLKVSGNVDFYYTGLASWFSAPLKSDTSLAAMVRQKILKAPPMSPELQAVEWTSKVHNTNLLSLLLPGVNREDYLDDLSAEDIDAWIASCNVISKRRLYERAWESMDHDPDRYVDGSIGIIPKLDELLMIDKTSVRPIFNMGPEMAVYFGCAVERATVNLKRMWDGYESYQLGLWTYYPVFSSGLSYVELGEILTRFLLNTDMHSSVLHFAAGDDTYILARDSSGIVVLEQDFSQYDASQSFVYDDDGVPRGPLANSLNFLDRLGVENHRLQNLLSSYLRRANVVFSESRLQLDFTSSCVFPTGSSMTTFNNTVNNITSFSVLLVGMTSGMVSDLREEFMAPTNAISALGFKCKVKSFSGVSEATFLKGRFSMFQYQVEGDNGSVDVRNGYLWHPDLCASLKYGKAKINPVSIYGGDFKTAFAKYLHGVAMSWDFYPKVPILRAFKAR